MNQVGQVGTAPRLPDLPPIFPDSAQVFMPHYRLADTGCGIVPPRNASALSGYKIPGMFTIINRR